MTSAAASSSSITSSITLPTVTATVIDQVNSLGLPSSTTSSPTSSKVSLASLISESPPAPALSPEEPVHNNTVIATNALSSIQGPNRSYTRTTTTVTAIETRTVVLPNTPGRPAAVSITTTTTATQSHTKSSTTWTAPAHITDLSDFNISVFPGGPKNLDIVRGIPAEASAAPEAWSNLASTPASDQFTAWDNSSSVLQLFYPEDSINPGNKPFGGAQFYAAPLDITAAKNVTLEYSVFFPADFEWVRGGKLPGLYGGHTGCSGGDEALDCFSTRLMWRRKGEGELYLYAPKDEQTDELCSDPQSVCDATYGLSIGRGSFNWAPGAWTTVRQTVTLNTPGQQDGAFTLHVNGKRIIERNDVFYRGEALAAEDRWKGRQRRKKAKKKQRPQGLGDLIGALLGGILVGTGSMANSRTLATNVTTNATAPVVRLEGVDATQGRMVLEMVPLRVEKVEEPKELGSVKEASTTDDASGTAIKAQLEQWDERPVGFVGLFFSTFFGGHEPAFATPKDQYVWFKDFSMSYNE